MTTRWMLVAILGGVAASAAVAQQGGAPAKRPPVDAPRTTTGPKKGAEGPGRDARPFDWPGELRHEAMLDMMEHAPPGAFHLDDSFMEHPPLLDWPGPGIAMEKLWQLDEMQAR